MDRGEPTEVEVVCTEGRTVRPIRVLWAGRRLTLVDWDEARAGADVWAGEAVAEDGRRLRLNFFRGRGGWRVAEVSGPARSLGGPSAVTGSDPRGVTAGEAERPSDDPRARDPADRGTDPAEEDPASWWRRRTAAAWARRDDE